MTKHFVEFLFPGVFVSESKSQEVATRDPANVVMPKGACGYRFYDLVDGEKVNYSPNTFVGQTFTLEQLKKKFSPQSTLIKNMEMNHYKSAVHTCTGNWFPVHDEDIVIEAA